MRRVKRTALSSMAAAYLRKREIRANAEAAADKLNIETTWKAARQTKAMASVLATLQTMMGERQRCMYCLDSHGCDIEHFLPKTPYPQHMFRWRNLLLCCTECGRIKGDRFPMSGKRPLLVNPCKEEPWRHLDFDPQTGNITARYIAKAHAYSAKGEATVQALDLDRREAMAAGYRKTWRRLAAKLSEFLEQPSEINELIAALHDADDHGLVGWVFKGSGQTEALAQRLHADHPQAWAACYSAFEFL